MREECTDVCNDEPQFTIGRWRITVKNRTAENPSDVSLEYDRPHYGNKERGPDITIEDRQAVIDLDSLCEYILDHIEPEAQARLLWENNEDVRRAFFELLLTDLTLWSDDERKYTHLRYEVLEKLEANLILKKIGTLAEAFKIAEYYKNQYWRLWNICQGHGFCTTDPAAPPNLRAIADAVRYSTPMAYSVEDPDYKIGSQQWHAARDWWREKIIDSLGLQPLLDK